MPLNRYQNNIISTRNMINELQISSNSVYTNIAENDSPTIIQSSEIEIEAGMNLTAGWLVAIKDGLVYKASNLLADNLQPIGIVKSTVLSGAVATVILSGIINTSLTLTLYPDTPLYIRYDTLNYNQTLLATPTADEDLIQKIGYVITTNSFLLKIENYIQII